MVDWPGNSRKMEHKCGQRNERRINNILQGNEAGLLEGIIKKSSPFNILRRK